MALVCSQSFKRGIAVTSAVTAFSAVMFFSNVAAGQPSRQESPAVEQGSGIRTSSGPQAGQETFSSAAKASHSLVKALQNNDQQALLKILGPDAKEIVSSGDESEDASDRAQFVEKYQSMHRLVTEPDGTTTLYIGAENWPTPIPLLHKGDAWYFDTAAGKQEILYRRVGRNELAVIQVCHELVDAEKEYYAQPHDGSSDRQYAQKFSSDPGKQNGLYWEASSQASGSPIGPLVAAAAAEDNNNSAEHNGQPFQGYYVKILTAQGPKAPGGSHSYIVDGKMKRGFAFLAYPAEYRSSGVMTFIVDQDGIVYEKNLGPNTAKLAKSLTRYERDSTWRKAD